LATVEQRVETVNKVKETQSRGMANLRTDVSALRSGLTGLTNSMFNLKKQVRIERKD